MSLALRATVLVALLAAFGQPALAAPASPATPPAGAHLLVRFSDDATDLDRDSAVRSVGGWVDATLPQIGVTRVAVGQGPDDGPGLAAYLATIPHVAFAEIDPIVHLSFAPNDPLYGNDPYVGLGQWGIRKASVDQAWDKVRGSASVTVATLDTGADVTHPDLQGVLVPGTYLVSQPSAACSPLMKNDDSSHGTHVAGIIGAAGNNAAGIAGVAFGVKVMPVKVLDCTGTGDMSDVASGLLWAVDHGAKIVNISLGSPFSSATLHNAITYAVNHNVLIVGAAGNCGTLIDPCTTLNQPDYPAAYPEVLAVGATDMDDGVSFFSTRNSTVDVAAPGRRIVSTMPTYATYLSTHSTTTLNYGQLSGTSQAAPFISGVAALIWSNEPTLTAQQVFQRIEATADQLEGSAGTRNDAYGYGRVNALRAVTAAATKPASTPPVVGGQDGAAYAPANAAAFPVLYPGGRAEVALSLTNTGSTTWAAAGPNPVHVAAHIRDARGNTVIWDGARTALPADVPPGGRVDVKVLVDAPFAAGPYRARMDLVREGVAWFSSEGIATSDIDVLVAPDYRATIPGGPLTVSRSGSSVSATIRNDSIATWTIGGASPVDVGVHWFDASGNVLVWDGPRTALSAPLGPGESVTVSVRLGPAPAGAAFVVIDLVSEGVAWFGQGPLRQVTLAP